MASQPDANGSRPSTSDDGSPHFDLDTYTSNYVGHTKIIRLRFIAEKCSGTAMELEALRMALDEIKKGDNTQMYIETLERVRGRLGRAHQHDREWVNAKEKQAAQRQERLELELNGYKVRFISFCPCSITPVFLLGGPFSSFCLVNVPRLLHSFYRCALVSLNSALLGFLT